MVAALLIAWVRQAAPAAADTSQHFGENRTPQSWVVPSGVTSATFDLVAAIGQGGACDRTAGFGGETVATIPVNPGETLEVNVGDSYYGETASGNASDVRRSPFGLEDRLIVAGGGGYNSDLSGRDANSNCAGTRGTPGLGGDGGDPIGVTGNGEVGCGYPGGGGGAGGTLVAGGPGGAICGPGGAGGAGTFGAGGSPGGSGTDKAPCDTGGRGGDGWYGGGGGASTAGPIGSLGGCTDDEGNPVSPSLGGGGGGGSSYVEPAGTGVVFTAGVNANYFGSVDVTTGTAPAGAAPAVTAISPHAGPLGGGRVVAVFGDHLVGVTDVLFGGSPATDLVSVSDSEITARVPAHAAGVVDVRTTSPDGTSAVVSTDRYTYLKVPKVSSVTPRSGARKGGRKVTILGSSFTTSSTVRFGTRAASHVVVLSAGRITARSPAHAAGRTDIRVGTAGGTSAKVSADRFRYR